MLCGVVWRNYSIASEAHWSMSRTTPFALMIRYDGSVGAFPQLHILGIETFRPTLYRAMNSKVSFSGTDKTIPEDGLRPSLRKTASFLTCLSRQTRS